MRALASYRDTLRERREHLDAINVFPVADADTGSNLVHTVEATLAGADRAHGAALVEVIAESALLAGRGASGLIFSQALIGLCSRLERRELGGERLAGALSGAALAAAAAVLDPVEGTMVSAARDAARSADRAAQMGDTEREVMLAARDGAWISVASSPAELEVLAEAGVVDSGALGYALFLDSLAREVDAGPMDELDLAHPSPSHARTAPSADRHEVVAVLHGVSDPAGLRSVLGGIGSSVGVSFGSGTAKVHLHTDRISAAIDTCREHGNLERLEVTDLVHQVVPGGMPTVVVVAGTLDDGVQLAGAGGHRLVMPGDEGQLLPAFEGTKGPLRVLAVGGGVLLRTEQALQAAQRTTAVEAFAAAKDAAGVISASTD